MNWPSHCRSTPELDRLRAHLSALMTYRVSADLLEHIFPLDAGTDPRTLRRHTLKAGAALADRAAIRPPAAVPAITVTVDSTFIRSREEGERRFEVRVANVETEAGGRQVFVGVANAATDIEGLIRKNLDAVGRVGGTALTAFTDGCPGLRGILTNAGVVEPPILDWFHIAMRLQHLKQIADGLAAGNPARTAAKAVIVTGVERLRWRICNRKAKNLRELPPIPYEYADWKRCRVNLDYHIEIDKHFYSVPFRLLREEVEARITAKTVEIFHRGKLVAAHLRSLRPYCARPTLADHMPSSHRRYRDWTHERILREAAAIGDDTAALIAIILRSRPHPEQGFRRLHRHPPAGNTLRRRAAGCCLCTGAGTGAPARQVRWSRRRS